MTCVIYPPDTFGPDAWPTHLSTPQHTLLLKLSHWTILRVGSLQLFDREKHMPARCLQRFPSLTHALEGQLNNAISPTESVSPVSLIEAWCRDPIQTLRQ